MTTFRPMFVRLRRHAAVHGLVLIVLTGCGGGVRGGAEGSPQPPPPPTPAALPPGAASLAPGTYRVPSSAGSVEDLMVTVPEGWSVQYGQIFLKYPDTPAELGFAAAKVDSIYADACAGSEGALVEVGPTVDDLVGALLEQAGPVASGPVDATIGGHPASRVDLAVPDDLDLASCNLEGIGLQIWYSQPADKYFVLLLGGTASVYVVDIDGQRQVFLTQAPSGTSAADLAELETILGSIVIAS